MCTTVRSGLIAPVATARRRRSSHDASGERAVGGALAATRTCADCHANPHGGHGAATALPLANSGDCARCHAATQWAAARPSLAAHGEGGFPLLGAHANVDCRQCHGDGALWWSSPAPAAGDCRACHASPHREALLAATPDCVACHRAEDEQFAVGAMPIAAHAPLFPLSTPHAELGCDRCHVGAEWQQRYPGRTPSNCRGCHRDVHAGQFDVATAPADCRTCHAESHWRPPNFGASSHAAAGFPLDGAHAAVGCQRCHQPVAAGEPVRFRGVERACAACHADPHRGAFAAVNCAQCHTTTAFAAEATFDHARWTGFALHGAHAAAACASCHPTTTAGQRGQVRGRACADCHSDPHGGQFAAAGATDCARCHDERRFRDLRFDHARDSRFALDGAHQALACDRCHGPAANGVVRYRPLGTTCGDCHRLGGGGAR
jgi:hypothetical protein